MSKTTFDTNTLIKIGLAVLFILCLFDWPYEYFQLVRFLAMCGFGYLAIDANTRKNEKERYLWICLALLFQPFLKIPLGRVLWNIVDVTVAVWLLYTVFIQKKH